MHDAQQVQSHFCGNKQTALFLVGIQEGKSSVPFQMLMANPDLHQACIEKNLANQISDRNVFVGNFSVRAPLLVRDSG
jgi:hypothetical protein